MSDTLYNLITCFVYGFVIYCFIHNPHFLVDHVTPTPSSMRCGVVLLNLASPIHIWITTGSAFLFAFLGEQPFLQFSLSSDSPTLKMTPEALAVYLPVFMLILFFILTKIRIVFVNGNFARFIFPIVSACVLYTLIYIQCVCKNALCGYHFHHSFLAGWLCLFTADVHYNFTTPSKCFQVVNNLIQCVTLGVFVQGINFYGRDDLKIISVRGPQSFEKSTSISIVCLLVLFPLAFLFLSFFKKKGFFF